MTVEPLRGAAAPARALPVGRIAAWLARQSELALDEVELSLPQYRVLSLLDDGIALPSFLADRLDVRRPSITAVVDGLVGRGLVERLPEAGDRRKVAHSITPAGRELVARADEAVERRLAQIAAAPDGDPSATLEGLARFGPALVEWRRQKSAAQVTS